MNEKFEFFLVYISWIIVLDGYVGDLGISLRIDMW